MSDVIEVELLWMATASIRHLRLGRQHIRFVSLTLGRFEIRPINGLSILARAINNLSGMRHDDVVAADRDDTFGDNILSESSLSPILSGNQK